MFGWEREREAPGGSEHGVAMWMGLGGRRRHVYPARVARGRGVNSGPAWRTRTPRPKFPARHYFAQRVRQRLARLVQRLDIGPEGLPTSFHGSLRPSSLPLSQWALPHGAASN